MKENAELHIINSGINYTIIRAGLLTQDPGTRLIGATEGRTDYFGVSSRENIAEAFIEALENENTYHKVYTVFDGSDPVDSALISDNLYYRR